MRIATVIGLPVEHRDEYLRLHREVWPGVLEALSRYGVRNYSIFLHDELLFSYWEYEGEDYERDMASLEADPVSIEWGARCARLQRSVATGKEWWTPVMEVFHLD